MSGERILVTGGCGFVGAQLVRQLVDNGHEVVVLDDLSLGQPENLGPAQGHIDLAVVDIRDSLAVADALACHRPEIVIHLAAIHFIPACDADPKRCIDVNAGGTQAVLDACAATDSVRCAVIASTAAVYAPDLQAHTEGSQLGPTDIYGLSKLWSEQLAQLVHDRTTLPIRVARLFNVFGPGETNPHLIPTVIGQAQTGADLQLGNLSTKRDYIFVEDVAHALIALAMLPVEHDWVVCNVGRGVAIDGQQIVQEIGQLMSGQLSVDTDPARVRASDRPVLLSHCALAEDLLSWRPQTDLQDGLRAAIQRPMAAGVRIG